MLIKRANTLAQFIGQIPAGQIVVVTSQGMDATAFLTAEARAELESVGLAVDRLQPPFSGIGGIGPESRR